MQCEHINLTNDVQNTPTKIDEIHAEMFQNIPNLPISLPNLHSSHLKNAPRLLEKASLTFQDPVTMLIPTLSLAELASKTSQTAELCEY